MMVNIFCISFQRSFSNWKRNNPCCILCIQEEHHKSFKSNQYLSRFCLQNESNTLELKNNYLLISILLIKGPAKVVCFPICSDSGDLEAVLEFVRWKILKNLEKSLTIDWSKDKWLWLLRLRNGICQQLSCLGRFVS